MVATHFKEFLLAFTLTSVSGVIAVAGPDGNGWDGAGWYVSSNAPNSDDLYRAQEVILFRGPIDQEQDCRTIFLRLYSPIGGCHYFKSKPDDRGR
jgi:hypothetical protein